MLTERALYERKWSRFPELGKLLDGKCLSAKWTGYSSVSDNIFDQVARLLEIYAAVDDNSKEIEQTVAGADHPIRRELLELSRGLTWVAERFAAASLDAEELSRRT
jgi:hypothetical protein